MVTEEAATPGPSSAAPLAERAEATPVAAPEPLAKEASLPELTTAVAPSLPASRLPAAMLPGGDGESPAKPAELSPTLQDSLNAGQAKPGGINIRFLDE